MSAEVIRIHPRRVISWNVDPSHPAMQSRRVQTPTRAQRRETGRSEDRFSLRTRS